MSLPPPAPQPADPPAPATSWQLRLEQKRVLVGILTIALVFTLHYFSSLLLPILLALLLSFLLLPIVNQLNRGSHLIASTKERERVAELNFIAGRHAKTSAAYASALNYLAAGRALLTDDSWDHNYELIFNIELYMAECELLTANKVAAENRLSMLAQRARSAHDIAIVALDRPVTHVRPVALPDVFSATTCASTRTAFTWRMSSAVLSAGRQVVSEKRGFPLEKAVTGGGGDAERGRF